MSARSKLISRLQADHRVRTAYIFAKLGVLVPAQVRALRFKSPQMPLQKDLAKAARMQQSRISMLETPGAANVTLETLAKVAAAFKVGVVVKFVPFSKMLKWENDFSQDAFDVRRLEQDEDFINPAAATAEPSAMVAGLGTNSLASDEAGFDDLADSETILQFCDIGTAEAARPAMGGAISQALS